MNKDIAVKWVAALRSGKYQQGEGVLRDGDSFCCLGVLCDISEMGRWGSDVNGYPAFMLERSAPVTHWLPEPIQKWAGLVSDTGGVPSDMIVQIIPTATEHTMLSLANLNDGHPTRNIPKMSFEQIADIIEKNWEKL